MKIHIFFLLLLLMAIGLGTLSVTAGREPVLGGGNITLVSVASDGTQGNGESSSPAISDDGRYVAFWSAANNLVSGDSNDGSDVFLHDRQTSETKRISVASDGTQGNNSFDFMSSDKPAISADGRYIAFSSDASNLVEGDTNQTTDIFVHDQETGQTTRVSVASDGSQADSRSSEPVISSDGRYVAFESGASNLASNPSFMSPNLFVHDRESGQTTLVPMGSDGGMFGGISRDWR